MHHASKQLDENSPWMIPGAKAQSMKPHLEDCWFLAGEIEHYSFEQMREVYLGILDYLHQDEIYLFASHELDALQMHEIRMGFKVGLLFEEVLLYASKNLPWFIMRDMRLRLTEAKRNGQPFIFTNTERSLIERGGDGSVID